MPLNLMSFYRTIHFICHWIGLHAIESYVILLDHILHFIGSDCILLDHTSFNRIINFMSLDRTPCHCNTSFCQKTTFVLLNLTSCHWIVDHSIELYTSCHWIELHAIGSKTSFDRVCLTELIRPRIRLSDSPGLVKRSVGLAPS